MEDNYQKDLAVKASLRNKCIGLFIGLGVGLTIFGTIFGAMIVPLKPTTIEYKCEGIDVNWLKDHPFDISSLPTEVNIDDTIVLPEISIEGYQLVGWYEGESGLSKVTDNIYTVKEGANYLTAKYKYIAKEMNVCFF